jgi:hypothetical protein
MVRFFTLRFLPHGELPVKFLATWKIERRKDCRKVELPYKALFLH